MTRPAQEIRWERYRRPAAEELDAAGLDAADWWLCAECLANDDRLSFYQEDALLFHDEDHDERLANHEPWSDDD